MDTERRCEMGAETYGQALFFVVAFTVIIVGGLALAVAGFSSWLKGG